MKRKCSYSTPSFDTKLPARIFNAARSARIRFPILILLCSIRVAAAPLEEFIVWNVGQGLWTTLLEAENCTHFDMGGERAPWRALGKACSDKQNSMHFSHWDWDHVSFARKAAQRLGPSCLATAPAGEAKPSRQRVLQGLSHCRGTIGISETSRIGDNLKLLPLSASQRKQRLLTVLTTEPMAAKKLTPNDSSRVFLLKNSILLPGDSTTTRERIWARSHNLENVRILVLGHHGSRTSTSELLLDRLPKLRQAVASARASKYGHPSPWVTMRLKRRGIAVLRTEDWGTIRFELAPRTNQTPQTSERRKP